MSELSAEFVEMLNTAHDTFYHGLRAQVLSPEQQDWEQRDTNSWLNDESWKTLWSVIGEGQYAIISGSERNDKPGGKWDGGPWRRASFFISPKGIENLKAWIESRKVSP